MTRQQEHAVEQMATTHGRLHIKEGFIYGDIHVTAPNGRTWVVKRNGRPVDAGVNFSIDWWTP